MIEWVMTEELSDEFILVREATVLVRISPAAESNRDFDSARLFDVRTGVELKGIHPPLSVEDFVRGFRVSPATGEAIIKSGFIGWTGQPPDAKVVSLLDVKQRRLDTVVADSILDQLRTITSILQSFLSVADKAGKEERLWLSHQLLTTVRKFSGRELAELEEMAEWLKNKSPKK